MVNDISAEGPPKPDNPVTEETYTSIVKSVEDLVKKGQTSHKDYGDIFSSDKITDFYKPNPNTKVWLTSEKISFPKTGSEQLYKKVSFKELKESTNGLRYELNTTYYISRDSERPSISTAVSDAITEEEVAKNLAKSHDERKEEFEQKIEAEDQFAKDLVGEDNAHDVLREIDENEGKDLAQKLLTIDPDVCRINDEEFFESFF